MLVEMSKWTPEIVQIGLMYRAKTQAIALCYTFIILGKQEPQGRQHRMRKP